MKKSPFGLKLSVCVFVGILIGMAFHLTPFQAGCVGLVWAFIYDIWENV